MEPDRVLSVGVRRDGRTPGRYVAALASIFGLATGTLLFAPAAPAQVPTQGELSISFAKPPNSGGSGSFGNGGLRVLAGGIATSSVVNGRVRVEMPATEVSTGSAQAVTRVGGTISFVRGDRRLVLSQLRVLSGQDLTEFPASGEDFGQPRVLSGQLKGTFITARLGNRNSRIRAFAVQGQAAVDAQVGTMRLRGRVTRLTGALAGRLQRKLDPPRRLATRIGKSTLDSQAAFEDPYGATCDLPATSKVAGTLPTAPDPSPVEPGTTAVGDGIFWGIRSGLRNYLFFLPDGQGVMQGIGGGVVVPNPAPPPAPPVPIGFAFPFADGAWNLGEEGLADDRVVLNGSGSILLCHQTQFRILLSKPSIVIDGFSARLVFDVDTNVLGEWIPTQRVTLAQLVTSEGSFSGTEDSATWANVPVVLTAAGSDALRLAPFSPTFPYQAGQALQPISFTLTSTVADGRG